MNVRWVIVHVPSPRDEALAFIENQRRLGAMVLSGILVVLVTMFTLATLPWWGPVMANTFSTVVGRA